MRDPERLLMHADHLLEEADKYSAADQAGQGLARRAEVAIQLASALMLKRSLEVTERTQLRAIEAMDKELL